MNLEIVMLETEGSPVNTDPSVIRQDRADATSLNEAGEAQFKNTVPHGLLKNHTSSYIGETSNPRSIFRVRCAS
jgi:hypothetical protein